MKIYREEKNTTEDQTNKDGGVGAVDMETKSYEDETIFQI